MAEPWTDHPDNYIYEGTRKVGINWPGLQQRYLEQCSPDELTAQVRKMRPVALVKVVQPNAIPETTIALIVNYYIVGNKIPWIAKELGITEVTIRKYLVDREVYEPNRDRSRKKAV